MTQVLTNERIRRENLAYVGTGGISQENRPRGFLPAFLDRETGRAALSRFANGQLAPIHLLDGLPETWIVERDMTGAIKAIKQTVIAGFVRDGYFYTRQQAALAMPN
jgi:hypothetical protein